MRLTNIFVMGGLLQENNELIFSLKIIGAH